MILGLAEADVKYIYLIEFISIGYICEGYGPGLGGQGMPGHLERHPDGRGLAASLHGRLVFFSRIERTSACAARPRYRSRRQQQWK